MDPRLVIILLAPAIAIAVALLTRNARLAEWCNLAASIAAFAATVSLPFAPAAPRIFAAGYLFLDRFGAWTLLCVAVVYLLASLHAIGYMRHEEDGDRRLPMFYALFAGFALTMLVAPMVNNLGVYWIAIELTTLVSTFLVGFERRAESMEAAWKYIIIVSAGISIALLGIVMLYWGGSLVLGPTYDLTWQILAEVAPRMNPVLLRLGFLLTLIGYGVKVGLAPMHSWLPDAHSEGPAPVSAMLSGALLNTAMLGIVRTLAATDAASAGALPHAALIVLGVLSVLIGTLFIVRQRDIKRLMAYSSVEHMGIIALGFGFGGVLGVSGALYHMLNHSLNKSLMFFGAGNVMRRYGTTRIAAIRGVLERMPVTGLLWLAGAVAITGAPPFGTFLGELAILRSGWGGPHPWAAVILLIALIVIFIGFLNHFRVMYFDESVIEAPTGPRPARISVAPMWIAVVALLMFGLWWPHGLRDLFAAIAGDLGAAP
ncbi:MAG: proton-conducting transporter membrane subunit [Rhodanobacteraceae bacterium]